MQNVNDSPKNTSEILTSAQMRAAEAAVIASGRVSGLELMERAGQGVIEAIFETWPDLGRGAHHAAVLCGPGNNGGDGFVIARLLRRRGWRVAVSLYGDPARLPPDAAANRVRWLRIGRVAGLPAQPDFGAPDLIVDALFGIGLTRPLGGFSAIFAAMAASGARIVAVDLPSGTEADGAPDARDWPAAPCDLAVTFHAEKPAHAGLRAAGLRVVVKPIGL